MNKYGLKREILIDILDKHNINDNAILLLLKTEIEIHDFYDDKRFMPGLKSNVDRQWRQDFLKEEAKEHIKKGDVDFAYKNLFELIRAENPGLHGANIHKMDFINESDKEQHENYYKEGFICEKEKNIIMEIINAIEEKENNNVITVENPNLNNLTKNNRTIKEKTKFLVKSALYGGVFGFVGFMLLMEFFKTNNILYIIVSVMIFLVTLLLLSPFYETFIFKKQIGKMNVILTKENDKIALDTAMILQDLHEIIKKESHQIPNKDNTYLLFKIKDQLIRNNCSITDIELFNQRINERTTTIGYELTTGWIIGDEDGEEWEDISKIVVSITQNDIIKVDYQNEINLKQINETLTKIETLIKDKYNKKIEINYIIRDKSKTKGEKVYFDVSEKDKPIWWIDSGIVNNEKLDVILTDGLIGSVEQKLKHKLPKKYLELLNNQNGGRLIRRYYYLPKNDMVFEIDCIYGISDSIDYGIVQENRIASDWTDYINLDNNIVFGGDISGGHAHYLFDYTDLNEVGEPKIIWYDNELDEKILLANSFEEFIDNLKSKEGLESFIYGPEKNK